MIKGGTFDLSSKKFKTVDKHRFWRNITHIGILLELPDLILILMEDLLLQWQVSEEGVFFAVVA